MLLFRLECRRLFSGVINKLVLVLFLLSGVFAIYQGALGYKSIRIDQYKSKIVFEKEREYITARESLPEAGSLAYYAFAPTEWKLSPWAAVFVGQSQASMAATKIQALALQGQIYDREIVNPAQQRTGGMDLGFVFVYLLPLVIGMLTVTLISDEQHAGRWRLLNTLPKGAFSLLCKQFMLRFSVIWLLVFALLVGAALLLSLPFDRQFLIITLAITLYMIFWFSLTALIMGLGKSSVVNSLSFLSVWIILAILIPGAVHLYLSHSYQTEAPLQASLKQRMVLNDGWDQDKQEAMEEFLKYEPNWRNTAPLDSSFHWKWYYAQQHLSDLAVQQEWQAYVLNNTLRLQKLQQLSVFSPCLFLQLKLNNLSRTSSEGYQEYLDQVDNYHKTIRHFFYDFLFNERDVNKEDIDNFPTFKAESVTPDQKYYWLVLATAISIGIALLSGFRLRKMQELK